MALNFPNPMRHYEEREHGIKFWGYDQTIEIPFFIEASALVKLNAETAVDEAGYLNTFDINREQIHHSALNAYSRRKKGARVSSYVLVAADF